MGGKTRVMRYEIIEESQVNNAIEDVIVLFVDLDPGRKGEWCIV